MHISGDAVLDGPGSDHVQWAAVDGVRFQMRCVVSIEGKEEWIGLM